MTYPWGGAGALHGHGAPVLGPELGERSLGRVGALLSVLELGLDLAVFGQVDGGDLLLQGGTRATHTRPLKVA